MVLSGSVRPDRYFFKPEKNKQKLCVMVFSKYKVQIHAHIKGDEVISVHIKSDKGSNTNPDIYEILPSDFRIYEAKVLYDWKIKPVHFSGNIINLSDTTIGKKLND